MPAEVLPPLLEEDELLLLEEEELLEEDEPPPEEEELPLDEDELLLELEAEALLLEEVELLLELLLEEEPPEGGTLDTVAVPSGEFVVTPSPPHADKTSISAHAAEKANSLGGLIAALGMIACSG